MRHRASRSRSRWKWWRREVRGAWVLERDLAQQSWLEQLLRSTQHDHAPRHRPVDECSRRHAARDERSCSAVVRRGRGTHSRAVQADRAHLALARGIKPTAARDVLRRLRRKPRGQLMKPNRLTHQRGYWVLRQAWCEIACGTFRSRIPDGHRLETMWCGRRTVRIDRKRFTVRIDLKRFAK
jgi:hypothetical protein